MAHILDGDWRSSIVKNGNPQNDGVFHIEVDTSNGKLEPKSKHGDKAIKGGVGKGSAFHSIRIIKESEQIEYRGVLIVDGATKIICGFQNLDPDAFLSLIKRAEENPREKKALFDQIQEIWVATKP